jgi:adenylate kinase
LDGFPRTVPQAEALDRMLSDKRAKLDAVIELKVDEDSLLKRIESRIAESTARGEALRADDNPDVLAQRLKAYRTLTAPLIAYYGGQGVLKSVDGMAPISTVAAAIEGLLNGSQKRPARSGAASLKNGSVRKGGSEAKARRRSAAVKIARKTAALGWLTGQKAAEEAQSGQKGGERQAPGRSRTGGKPTGRKNSGLAAKNRRGG